MFFLAEAPAAEGAAYDPRRNVGKALIDAAALMTRSVDRRARAEGVSAAQWMVLIRIGGGVARTASELCHTLGYDSGAMKRMLDRLEQGGLILRSPSRHDARVLDLALTRRGVALYQRLRPIAVDVLNERLRDFTPEEAELLLRLLERIIATEPPQAAAAAGEPLLPSAAQSG